MKLPQGEWVVRVVWLVWVVTWVVSASDFKLSTHELTRNKLLGQRA